jgi:hypothetical protein
MKPKFADIEAWRQAELLMQPAFIRVIDNLRKQLEQTSWKGSYRDVPIWADDTPEDVKATVARLQEQLKTASPQQTEEIQNALSHLPSPHPGYELCLQQADRQVTIDLWELCYRVCFANDIHEPVRVDTSLIDEAGAVDWDRLDEKTKALVEQIFENLPD